MKAILLAAALLFGSAVELFSKDVYVRGYRRKDGTYVRPHVRSSPNSSKTDNYGSRSIAPPQRYWTAPPAATAQPAWQAPIPFNGVRLPAQPAQRVSPEGLQKNSPAASTNPPGARIDLKIPKSPPIHEASGPLFDERKAALEYQQQSAARGNPQAQYSMALRYLSGIDVPKDEQKGRQLLFSARRGGDLRARDKIIELDRARRKAKMQAEETSIARQ